MANTLRIKRRAAGGAAGAPASLANAALGTLMIFGVLRSAKAQVLYELASNVLHEKSETVSLLLREFEETSADWLWQTDNSRRLVHVSPRLAFAIGAPADQLEGIPLLQALSGDAWETGNFPKSLHDMAERMKRRESFSNLIVPVTIDGTPRSVSGRGNGLMSSVIAALAESGGPIMDIVDYSEHAIGQGSNVQAAAYVLGSVALSLIAVALGVAIARSFA